MPNQESISTSFPKMLKSVLFKRKKAAGTSKPFEMFYNEWFATLADTLLPRLRGALSSVSTSPALLSAQVDSMHHHLRSYYENMDLAVVEDVAQCLYPEWRNSLEKPFLWLADLHPYLFTNLLRSFLDDQESEDGVLDTIQEIRESREFLDERWHVAVAWRSPSKALTTRVDQIECGLRLMVPALAARARLAQMKLVRSVGNEWGRSDGVKAAVEEALGAEMEELVGVVVDANRLRKSVLADILSVTSVYQAALFLEAFAEFLVGFRDDKLLKEFDECKMCINS
ncbi:protein INAPERTURATE POLLEN1-like [Primulina eburnea]|uniref:protein INAPERTURATE POLLEN1-like n=1 Tax=Primulina eburnea TaxID=1245227 RepID=UPI003C6C85EF